MNIIRNITIGSDPEFAAFDENGIARSAVGFIPGTKKEPYPLEGDWGIQIDNVGVELTIPVVTTEEEFVHAMTYGKELAQRKLQETKPSWEIRAVSSARYGGSELNSRTAREFGCESSYCVYTQDISPRPTPAEVGNLRSFGCHIHIGYKTDEDSMTQAERIIKAMDITCGLGSIIIDTDKDRRSIYGNAGDFRFRQIEDVNIVEYRTLGSAMACDEERLSWIFNQTMLAVDMVNNWQNEYDTFSEIIKEAIDTGDIEKCRELLTTFKIQIPLLYDIHNAVFAD